MRLLTFFLLASLPLHAAEEESTVTWYDVELIVFRHVDARTAETWPPDAGVPVVENARPLFPLATDMPQDGADTAAAAIGLAGTIAPVDGTPTPYVPLDKSAYQLQGVAASLRRSSKYEPLLHVAWTQPPLDREQSPYLRVSLPQALPVEEKFSADESVPYEEPLLGRTTDDDENAVEFSDKREPEPRFARPLDGVVQLSVSRYLHLDLDLLYLPEDVDPALLDDMPAATREWTEEERLAREQRQRDILDALARGDITLEEAEILSLEPEQDVFQGFRLDQFRRLRSREIHYFDHPAFGAIVMVTPREVPARTLEMESPSGVR